MARKATKAEAATAETEAAAEAVASAADFAEWGRGQIAAGREAIFNGILAGIIGRIVHVKVERGKAADYDAMIADQIDGSRATRYRVKSAIAKGSIKVGRDFGTFVSGLNGQSVDDAVDALRAEFLHHNVSDQSSLDAWIKGNKDDDDKTKTEKTADMKALAMFDGDKPADLSDDTLTSIAKIISTEMAKRRQQADANAQAA